MNFNQLVLDESFNNVLDNLNIRVRMRPKTRSKHWKDIADVYINGEKKAVFGTNDGFQEDYGYDINRDIPGINKDTLSKDHQALKNLILKKLRSAMFTRTLSPETEKQFGDELGEL